MAYDAHSGDLPDFHLCCQKVHVYICACVARTCISLLIGLLIKLLALAVGHHDAAVICLNSFFDSVELQQPLSSRSRIHLQARGGRASDLCAFSYIAVLISSMFSLPSFAALSVSSLLAFSSLGHADLIPYIADKGYDAGEYGSYPMQDFKSTRIRAPRVNIMATSPQCDDEGQYIFLNPRGRAVPEANPMILDSAGNLVWTLDGKNHGETYNLGVQTYKGEQYLTFWGGNDAVGGHGQGKYYMVSSSCSGALQSRAREHPPPKHAIGTCPSHHSANRTLCAAHLSIPSNHGNRLTFNCSLTRATIRSGRYRQSAPSMATCTSSILPKTRRPYYQCTKSLNWI